VSVEVSKKRVVAAMSGGVDSSVAAYLLKSQGYEVLGVTIKTWSNNECRDEKSKGCCSLRDIDDARSVARKLEIPYYVMDLSSDFKEKVMDYFVDEYLAGRTPNPCIECNRHIKFGLLLKKAEELGASFVATGHYARVGFENEEKRFFIREAVDPVKDQSYVLFGLTQEQLSKTLLPVGELSKPKVREIAGELGLRVFDKPDSQEICFVKKSYGDFVKEYAPERLPGQGSFIDEEGRQVGTHEGSHLFTVGQRKRINLASPKPYFVTQIESQTNTVLIGAEESLYREGMMVRKVNWQLRPRVGEVAVKIRYKTPKATARIVSIDDESVKIQFREPQKAITPGQAAVFYDQDRVLGGGWISSSS
jgi:tRNA-uridine 2-sulfurtransferase